MSSRSKQASPDHEPSRGPVGASARVPNNLGAMGGGVIGSALLQYALFIWVARYLGTQSYGTFSIALTVAVLSAPLCDLGMSVSMVRSCSRRPESMPEVLGACVLWRLILLVPIGVVAAAFCRIAGYSPAVLAIMVPLFLGAFLDGVSTLCSSVFQTWEKMGVSAAILLARNLARGAVLLITMLAGGGLVELSVGFLVASAFVALPACALVLRSTTVRFDRRALLPTLRDAAPFGAAIFAAMLHSQVDVTVLAVLRPEAEVGLYHAAVRFIIMAQMIPQTVAVVAAPLSYRLGARSLEASSKFYRVKTTALAIVGLLATLVLVLHGEKIVATVLGARYSASAPLLVAIAPAVFLKFLSSPLGDALSSIDRQGRLCLGTCMALAINVCLNLWLIPTHGALGAVAATLASESFLLAVLAFWAVRAGLRLEWGSVLAHPLAAASAVAVLYGVSVLFLPRGAQHMLIPAGAAVWAVLVILRPTPEERLLLGRERPGERRLEEI